MAGVGAAMRKDQDQAHALRAEDFRNRLDETKRQALNYADVLADRIDELAAEARELARCTEVLSGAACSVLNAYGSSATQVTSQLRGILHPAPPKAPDPEPEAMSRSCNVA